MHRSFNGFGAKILHAVDMMYKTCLGTLKKKKKKCSQRFSSIHFNSLIAPDVTKAMLWKKQWR